MRYKLVVVYMFSLVTSLIKVDMNDGQMCQIPFIVFRNLYRNRMHERFYVTYEFGALMCDALM